MRVLIIEDNADLAANIYDFLEAKGYTVDAAADGVTGLHLAVTFEFDVIVLDLMLPGIDGLSVCRRLRDDARKNTPVLVLTAKDTLDDKLEGFRSGADDYLVKPFALQELDARLLALVRRAAAPHLSAVLQVADLSLDTKTLQAKRANKTLVLTPTGFTILELLMRRASEVVSRGDIEHAVWGDNPPDSDALRSHMHTLRAAVDHPFSKSLIHTVHGKGFRLADTDEIHA